MKTSESALARIKFCSIGRNRDLICTFFFCRSTKRCSFMQSNANCNDFKNGVDCKIDVSNLKICKKREKKVENLQQYHLYLKFLA